MIEITIDRDGKKESYKTNNYLLVVDSDLGVDKENLSKSSVSASSSPEHLMMLALTSVAAMGQKLGMTTEGALLLLQKADKSLDGHVMAVSNENLFSGGGSNELN